MSWERIRPLVVGLPRRDGDVLVAELDLYGRARVTGHEDGGGTYAAVWKPLEAFRAGEATLYPEGLLALLDGDAGHVVPSE